MLIIIPKRDESSKFESFDVCLTVQKISQVSEILNIPDKVILLYTKLIC